jgi:hypothetical protein
MKQYPIWCIVDAPEYKSSKSFGTRNYTTTDVRIGSSSVNSFGFVTTEVRKSVVQWTPSTEAHLFEFLVDGVVVKKTYYNPKTKKILKEENCQSWRV